MPICSILNGYYRSGTTILWWILQLSNLEVPFIYEPHSPAVFGELKNIDSSNAFWTINKLHGLPIYFPYFVIRSDIRKEYFEKAVPKPVYFTPEDAIKTIEMFNKAVRKVIIQSNQLHPVLNSVSERFSCNYVHVIRDPAETFFSHLPAELRSESGIRNITRGYNFDKVVKSFWIDYIYNEVANKFKLKADRKDSLGMFAIAWVVSNYTVVNQVKESKRGIIVSFEKLVERDADEWYRMVKHLNISLDEGYLGLMRKDRVYRSPELLKHELEIRFKKYGLTEMVEELLNV